MKENIIQAIVAKMQRDLDYRQMAQLKAVLTSDCITLRLSKKRSVCTSKHKKTNSFLTLLYQQRK